MADPFVRPDAKVFLDMLNAMQGPKAHEVGAAEARKLMSSTRGLTEVPVGELAVIRDLVMPGPGGDIPLRLFDAREERGAGPLMVYLHGGGFVFGDLDSHAPLCAELARKLDLPVLSVDYRLAPEHPWPAAPEDCIAAARWAAGSPEALGLEVTGLVLAGDSAGGNLAIIAGLSLRDEPAAVPVLAQWPLYPLTNPGTRYASHADFSDGFLLTHEGMQWFDECYRADHKDWRYNPMVKSQAGMPRTLVTTASLDPLRDQGRHYAAACIEAGVPTIFQEAEGNIHGFAVLRKAIPSSAKDVARGVAALKLLLSEVTA